MAAKVTKEGLFKLFLLLAMEEQIHFIDMVSNYSYEHYGVPAPGDTYLVDQSVEPS